MFEGNFVEARTLNDAWRDTLWCCVRNGYDQRIHRGSYQGQIRRQLPYLTIRVTEPGTFKPIQFLTPPGVPVPTNAEKIENYFYTYLMSDHRQGNDYTYGYYISAQYDTCMNILRAGQGNQATIQIGDINSIELENPPCLRTISFKLVNGKLNMAVYFRSWDLYAGLPENLGGLQLLNELMSYDLDIPAGELVAFTDGGHIYDHLFPLVDQLCADKIGGLRCR